MKKILLAMLLVMGAILLSCNKDGEPGANAKVTFRKANIGRAKMIALAQGAAATKAEGDMTIGPKALYTVSEDGSMVQVSYNVEVEGVDGEVAESIQANLIISPGFVFPVGDGWLWLSNCFYSFNGDWSAFPESTAKKAMSKIMGDFNNDHHEAHGAHYLIRKSDGALFEWTQQAGAPFGMDDGFKQPTFLNGWFVQYGNELFVKVGGWTEFGGVDAGRLYQLKDQGNTLDVVSVLGDNIFCDALYPAGDYLGASLGYPGAMGNTLGILAAPSFQPVIMQSEGKEQFLISIGNKLYLGVNTTEEKYYNDGKENYFDGYIYKVHFYNLNVSASSISQGSLICSADGSLYGGPYISSSETLSWWEDGTIHTFDPAAAKVSSRALPAHYPTNEYEYVDGVAYTVDGTSGFWECDLSKDAAEYVKLDWSSAAEYQGKIVSSTLRLEHFEAASRTLRFVAYMTDGTELNFYTSVTGTDRGVIKTTVGSSGNAGMVVTTMIRLN